MFLLCQCELDGFADIAHAQQLHAVRRGEIGRAVARDDAITTRGAKEDLMVLIAELIEEVLNDPENEQVIASVRARVNETMKNYPLFAY